MHLVESACAPLTARRQHTVCKQLQLIKHSHTNAVDVAGVGKFTFVHVSHVLRSNNAACGLSALPQRRSSDSPRLKRPGLNFLDMDMRAGEGRRRADFANVHRRIRLAWHCVGTKHEYLIRFKQGKQYVRS